MTDTAPTRQLALPGLDHETPTDSAMVKAARASLAELRELGQLSTRHAAQAQLVLSLAAAVDAGARSGRASATAMAARELRETMLVLDPPPEDNGGVDQLRALRELMDKLDSVAAAAKLPQLRVVE